ncbi:MAG TPA: FkbM family methyltransferase [Flavisolibacter sp.]|jgi:FkbM family methyltransferase
MTAPSLNNLVKMLLYKMLAPVRDRWQPLLIEKILEKNFKKNSPFFFIQVGAHDGIQYDSLYDFVKGRDAKGVVIEPLPDLYRQLTANYAAFPGVIAVNKAVHPIEKRVMLYRVDPEQSARLPEWASGISSLFADHYKKSGIPASAVISEAVVADHLMNIVAEYYGYEQIDFLQIDVEGFDYEVLKQIDFRKLTPAIIKFEYINLAKADAKAAIHLLKKNGYWCFHQGMDIIASRLYKIKL